MPASVVADVLDGAPHFRRRAKDVAMVPVREHAALSLHDAVEPARHANRQRLRRAREGALVVSLNEKMNVVAQDREGDEPDTEAVVRGAKSAAERLKTPARPQ